MFDNLTKLQNVVIGVQKIQERGFIHGDLKAINIIAIDGTFKIGDNSDLRSIADDKAKMLKMPQAFEYYVWPSIVIYSYFFRIFKLISSIFWLYSSLNCIFTSLTLT